MAGLSWYGASQPWSEKQVFTVRSVADFAVCAASPHTPQNRFSLSISGYDTNCIIYCFARMRRWTLIDVQIPLAFRVGK